jgi:hypothetical protein
MENGELKKKIMILKFLVNDENMKAFQKKERSKEERIAERKVVFWTL